MRRLRASTAILSITAVVAATTAVINPVAAHAGPPPTADQNVQDIWSGLDAFQSFSQGLATDGAFGSTLTDLGLAPGGGDGIGFGDLLQKLFIDRLTAANPMHLADLVGALATTSPIDLETNGRSASVSLTSSTSGNVTALAFDVTVNRRVASTTFKISSTSPKFDFTAPVQVDLAFHASFTVDYDSSTRGVYFDMTHAPAITLGADAHFPCTPSSASPPCTQDASAVHAGVGVLGVSLDSGSSLDLTTNLTASLRDPNGDGRVYLGTFSGGAFHPFDEPSGTGVTNGELSGGAAAAAGMVGVSFAGTPGALHATLNLIASVDPALMSVTLPGVMADVAIDWADISTGAPTVSVTSGALSSIQSFQNLSPVDLAQGMAQIATALEGIQMSRSYSPTNNGKTGTVAAIAAGDTAATYTATNGGNPETGDFFQVGGSGGPVREVSAFDSGTNKITFGSPLNDAVSGGTTITQVDVKGDVDLPFMKGTLADVFAVNEAIVAFLKAHVTQTYNPLPTGRKGTLSGAAGNTATYTVVSGSAPQNSDYYQIGTDTKKVTAVSGTGPYTLTFDSAFSPAPADGTGAVEVQLGDVVPDFTSLQSMLVELKGATGLPGGSSFTIGTVSYDAASSKLAIGLGIARDQAAAISLDPFQQVDAGTASAVGTDSTTGNPTLSDSTKNWQPSVYEGRQVRSGDATNIVKSNDAHTLTFIGPWHGTAPAASAAYQIGAQDSQTGAITFANKLNTLAGSAGSGILNANAQIPLATVQPSYSVALTLVLDLQSPKDGSTGHSCIGLQYNGATNSQECPFTATNPDGTSTVVTQLPTSADRVMIRTADGSGTPLHLITADAPIHSEVDLNASVGFLGLHLTGTLDECAQFSSGTTCPDPATSSTHLISVDFKPGLGDAQHDVSLAAVFKMLASDPTSLAGITVHGQVKASLSPDISGIPGLTASDFFGGTPSFLLSMGDITDPSTISFDTNGFSTALDKIKSFNFDTSNPKALFGEILQTLKMLSKTLKTIGGDGSSPLKTVLETKIPGVGITLGDVFNASEQGQGANVSYDAGTLTDTDAHFTDDLIGRLVTAGTSTGLVTATTATSLTIKQWQGGTPAAGAQYQVENALESAIDMLTANPADNLQQLIALVNNRLGALSVPITISVDTSGATPVLGLQLDWKRDFHFTTPIAFNFNIGSASNSIVGTQASGLVHLHAQAEAKIKLLLDLSPSAEAGATDKSALQIDPQNSSLSASIDGGASGYLKANFGPLNLSLGEPVASPTHPADANATFGISVGSHDTTPESLSSFVGDVASNGFQFNQGLTGVSCSGDTTPNLALCAAFPIYLSTDGGQTYTPVNSTGPTDPPDTLRLRLPLSGDLSQEFALTDGSGNVLTLDPSDSTTPKRLDIPPTLLTDLQHAVLDFSQLGQGLDGYFHFAEQALNLASFGGKLPLVGSDLQQGAQFLETVQGEIDQQLGSLASVGDVSALRDWVNNQLDTALSGVLPSGSKVAVDFICNATLGTPTNVAGSAATAGSTHYLYRVSATTAKGAKESLASDPATDVTSAALSSTNTITLTWNKVDNAYAYKVYRSSDGGTTWVVFDAAQADSPTFTDTGAAGTAGTPTLTGSNPSLDPCPMTDLTGVTLTADIGQGKISADNGCEDQGSDTCLTASVPLNIGIPGLSISARTNSDGTPDASQNLSVKVGWHIHLKIGLDKNRGFFIETQDQNNPEIALGLAVSLPSHIDANITFLKIHLCDFATGEGATCPFTPLVPNDVTRTAAADKPLFAGEFGIDLHTPGATKTAFDTPAFTANDDAANDIRLSDLTNLGDLKKLVTVGLSAKVHIDWDFQAEIDSSLPGVGGEFKLDWAWGTQLGGTSPTVATDTGTDAAPPVDGTHTPNIEFDNVYITAGGFLTGVLKPIVQEVQKFTSPLKPVIDTLYAPIPVLSDLSHLAGGGDVTLITIAEAFSTLAGGPDLTMVERVLQVIKMINAIPAGDDNLGIFVGTFHISGDKAINTTATPDNSGSMIGSQSPAPASENNNMSTSDAMNSQSNGSLDMGKSKAGFSFPLLDNPSSIFNLLMGGDVDLVRFDSGNLTLGFSYSQQFGPVYAPPPVVITISGSASVTARIIAGFDTYGLRKAYESIKAGQGAGTVVGNILDSLFLYTTDPTKNDGKPVPVLTLHGELAAGAAVTVLIVSVGIEGGISLTINFYWHDPDNDGKFRLSEFVAAALNNPLCLFDLSGTLSVFLRLYITFGFGPFSVTFSFTLVNVTLLDFSYHPDCSPPPPELGEVQDHVLYLFFGALGSGHQRGDPWGNSGEDESVKVHELHDDTGAFTGFAVDGLNRHEEFLDSSITTVVLDARGYGGKENVVIAGDSNESQAVKDGPPPARPFDKTAIIFGGTNDDNIKIDGGTAYVDGGAGNDTINLAGNGNDYVAGGPGNDTITVGNGNDYLAGDSALPITSTVTLQNHRQQASGDKPPQGSWADVAGEPTGVGQPDATEASTDGNDSILAGYGANHIFGNGGDDTISIATDTPLTGSQTRQPGVNGASDNVIVGGTGNNNIHGGAADDTIYAGQQWPSSVTDPANYAGVAGDGNNQVDTGPGNDTVYGGSANDFVVGHSVHGGQDTFYGGAGDDILVGGDGADHIYGGPGNDYISGGPAKVDAISPTDPVLGDWKITPTPDGNTVDGKLLVGGDGNDHIYGANGGDEVYGDRQEDKCVLPSSGPRSTPPSETNSGSPGNDYIVGGNGNNSIQGGGGDDTIYAGTGNDLLCGGAGADKLYGGPGKDTLFGGSGNDLLVAGTGNSALYGNDGNDTIIAGSGNDWVEGNDGSDTIDGGSGQSVIIGGTSAEKQKDEGDTIFGGSGNNIIIGDNGTVDANPDWPNSGKPFVEPVVVHSFDLTANAPDNTTYGGNDVITGGSGNDQIYGGLGDDYIVGGTGTDHIEGGPGCDTIYGGSNNDDILGGTSPQAVAGGSVDGIPDGCDGSGNDTTPATLGTFSPVIGNTIYGYLPYGPNPNHANVIVGGNGSITPTGVTDPNDGAPVRSVQQLALLTVGGNDTIYGGPGPDQIFGGLGDDTITTGNGDNYVEGGPGDDHIYGGTGSNDIIGGTSPLTLPTSGSDALTTAKVPDGNNWIYADGNTAPPAAGAAQDGGNVVLGNNGCISRGTAGAPTDSTGCPTGPSSSPPAWQYSLADPTVTAIKGTLVRPVIRQLDVFDCPNGSCATPDVQGGADHIWGGTGDDLLFGEVGNDEVYGGPPGTNGVNGTAGSFVGNDYIEGGSGSDTIAGGAGDDDLIGGSAPTYLPPGRTTAMISDGTPGGSGFTLPAPANSQLSVPGSGVIGNTMDGGAGNDVMLGGNGSITHVLTAGGTWAKNPNDGAFRRTPVNLDLLTIGGDDTMRGGPGDDRMFGGLGNDYMVGGTGDDYLEGGPGRDVLQGSEGDDDLVGGTSPVALPPPPAGMTKDQVAANTPDGTPDPANPGQRLGNIICGFLCGQSTTASDDDAIIGNNGRIDRCPATVSSGVGTPQGSDTCTWTRTSYGTDKVPSAPGVAQAGAITTTSLGNPRTRYVTLLGQSPTDTTSNGNDYIEGNSGNDVIWGEDGNDAVHGDTPAPNSPRLDECLPTNDPTAGQDIIVGGYGNDVLCGDGGNDAVVGNRALVTVVPFSNSGGGATTIGQTGGAPYGTFTFPHSGNTIYQVDLSQEYVDGVLTPVPNWNNPAATGQNNQHDIIFGGQGNDTLHGSPGADFIEGDDGMHIAGQPASTGGDDILFGGGGGDSLQGGPGNDHLYGGAGNSDLDVMRSDTAIPFKVNDARACLPMAFPTITVDPTAMLSAEGCPTTGWGLQSYASRFPLPMGYTYSGDPGLADNGGNTHNSTLFGDIMYGGFDRDMMQSQAGGYGDRMIDDFGAYNLEFACPGAYGGYQINRALSPSLRTFLLGLAQADGATTPSIVPSSGGVELSLIYSGDSKGNSGPDYPTTPGHFTC